MAKYKVTFKQSVRKDFRKIPAKDVKKILARIDTLANDPRAAGCKKLSTEERYRVRQGQYRIIYEIQDAVLIVVVVKIAHLSKRL